MKMHKILSLMLALVMVCSVMAGCGEATSTAPESESGAAQNTVDEKVVHATLTVTGADGMEKEFALESKEGTTLAMAMLDAGLVSEAEAKAGFITIIDGEEAKWDPDKAFWKLLDGSGNMTQVGAGDIVLKENDSYSFVYTAE